MVKYHPVSHIQLFTIHMLPHLLTFVILATGQVTLGQKIRVTCIGDSITFGLRCGHGPYTTFLAEMLGPNYEVINAAMPGMTMLKKGECRYEGQTTGCSYWDTAAWQVALNSDPDIVTIMLGTNDAKDYNWLDVQQNTGDFYALDYVDMVHTLRRSPKQPQVYLMTPPPLYETRWGMNTTLVNHIFPVLLRNLAQVLHRPLIDVHSAFSRYGGNRSELICDNIHPTLLGKRLIAKTIADAITGKITEDPLA
jgi:acyl-CoA thioesterase-1